MDVVYKKQENLAVKYFMPMMMFILFCLYSVGSCYILFDLTLKECLFHLFAYYSVVTIFIAYIEKHLFLWLYPQSKAYFPQINSNFWESATFAQQKAIVLDMLHFPYNRFKYMLITNIPLLLYCGFLIVFIFNSNNQVIWQRIIIFTLFAICTVSYFQSLAFISLNKESYNNLQKLHKKYDLKNIFCSIQHNEMPKDRSFIIENITLCTLSITTTVLVLSLVIRANVSMPKLTFILVTNFTALLVLYYEYRKLFLDGIKHIFSSVQDIDFKKYPTVALHSANELALFEQLLNKLIYKLEVRDKEIEQWLCYELEADRFRDIGEMSSVVIHDINGMMHSIQYANKELETTQKENSSKYHQAIEFSLNRSLELLDSLRAKMKNPDNNSSSSSLKEAWNYTLEILKIELRRDGFLNITFLYDELLEDTYLSLSRVDLIHILYNTIKNASVNLLKNSIKNPTISISCLESSNSYLKIVIKDNGTGLSVQEFEEMTSLKNITSLTNQKRGLGLKLTRRLIEKSNGHICVLPKTDIGTTIEIGLIKQLDAHH